MRITLLGTIVLLVSSMAAWTAGSFGASAPARPDRGPSGSAPGQVVGARVFASFYPLEFFAQEIAGDRLSVTIPDFAGVDPAHWRPSRARVEELQSTPLILVHGAGFEHWLDHVSLPLARTRVMTRSFLDRLSPFAAGVDHTHGTEALGAASGLDPHTWLSPDLAEAEARAACAALVRRFPEFEAEFEARMTDLLPRFQAWREALESLAVLMRGQRLVASHPSYEYLARAQGWRIENVPLEREELPTAETLQQLELLRESGARLILWEDSPSSAVEKELQQRGFGAVLYSPAEALDAELRARGTDFFDVMMQNVANLRSALSRSR